MFDLLGPLWGWSFLAIETTQPAIHHCCQGLPLSSERNLQYRRGTWSVKESTRRVALGNPRKQWFELNDECSRRYVFHVFLSFTPIFLGGMEDSHFWLIFLFKKRVELPSLGCLERRELSEPMAKSFKVYIGCLAFPKRKRARYLDFSGANCWF